MNVLITTGIFPPDVGGPATYVPRLAQAMVEKEWSVEVITAGQKEDNQTWTFPVHRVPRPFPERIIHTQKIIFKKRNWIDRLYVNGLEIDHYLSKYVSSTPSVQKIVGDRSWEKYRNRGHHKLSIDQFQTSFPGIRSWIERTFCRKINKTSDQFIVPSRYLKKMIKKWNIDEKSIHVIHNHSLPPQEIPDRQIDWPGSKIRLLSVGRLVPWKKVNQLVEVLTEFPEAGLIVLGDGPRRSTIEKTIQNNNQQSQIDLKGNVSRGSVWNHLQKADLLVLNSTYEGFPHVLLESIQSGTPVIARSSGGSRELKQYFPDKIFLYGPKKSDLKNALEKKSSYEKFSPPELPGPLRWKNIVDKTLSVLEETQ